MKLSFFGAAGEVTGSCYLLETSQASVLIDFGMHQGGPAPDFRNRTFPPIDTGRLAAVVLTHAHIDHTGRLPLLPLHGYRGPIFATGASCELTELLLKDSAELQVADIERANRHGVTLPPQAVRPLYTPDDVEPVLKLLRPVQYDQPQQVAPGVTARLVDAGHILGSASIELTIREGGAERILAFSGDIGEIGSPLLRDPVPLTRADFAVMECTYGDRDHRGRTESVNQLADIIQTARADGGRIVIPSFAVGRTQQIVYHLGELYRLGKLGSTQIYIDSPMAVETTDLYCRHREDMDEQTWAIINKGDMPLHFPGVHYTRSVDESKKLNAIRSGVIIISASGMANGGRVLHHLLHTLWQKESHIVIIGYQAEGTLGRQLVDGAKSVSIHGENVQVAAKIHTLGGFSAHTGQTGLLNWAANFKGAKPRMFLTHGEQPPRNILRQKLQESLGIDPERPNWKDVATL